MPAKAKVQFKHSPTSSTKRAFRAESSLQKMAGLPLFFLLTPTRLPTSRLTLSFSYLIVHIRLTSTVCLFSI